MGKILFDIGDIVEVVKIDHEDKLVGVKVGDLFKVIERCTAPYCIPVKSDCELAVYSLNQDQVIFTFKGREI